MPLLSTADGAGAVDDLSLVECEAYDPSPRFQGGRKRFKCPRHGGDNQRSLSVDEDGKFRCHNASCGIWGTLVEFKEQAGGWGKAALSGWAGPARIVKAEPMTPSDYAVQRATGAVAAFRGSAAEGYARRRGVPDYMVEGWGLGYWRGEWGDENSEWLTFPLRCPVTGEIVGVSGRNIHSDDQQKKARHLGPRGLFGAIEPGPLPVDVLLCEGAFDALAVLNNAWLPPARALMGATARAEWFDPCRRVSIALDDEKRGYDAADKLIKDLNVRRGSRGSGPQILCIRAGTLQRRYGDDVKDFGKLMELGIDVELDIPDLEPVT